MLPRASLLYAAIIIIIITVIISYLSVRMDRDGETKQHTTLPKVKLQQSIAASQRAADTIFQFYHDSARRKYSKW